MQPVDVLGDDATELSFIGKCAKGVMACVRRPCDHLRMVQFSSLPVVQSCVTGFQKVFDRRGLPLRPHSSRPPVIRNSGLRGNSSTSEGDDAPSFGQIGGHRRDRLWIGLSGFWVLISLMGHAICLARFGANSDEAFRIGWYSAPIQCKSATSYCVRTPTMVQCLYPARSRQLINTPHCMSGQYRRG